MSSAASIRLLLFFAVGISLIVLPAHVSGNIQLPILPIAQANTPLLASWLPAGPATDTEKANIYTDSVSADTALLAEQVDLSDEPIQRVSELNCLQSGIGCPPGVNPVDFSVTAPIAEHGYFELEFLLSNNFWGVPLNFGNDAGCTAGSVTYTTVLTDPKSSSTTGLTTPCPGVSIRQGIAHLLDKNIFAATVTGCVKCIALDNPVPPNDGLPTPNSCSWDTLFPSSLEAGPCQVGPDPATGTAGGVSYHFATATSCGAPSCASTPLSPWEPGFGTPDFCAAADHFIAAGLATGKDPTTCILTGISPNVPAHTVNIFTRNTDPRRELGNSIADEICALFTGTYGGVGSSPFCPNVPTTNSVLSGAYITQTTGTLANFPCFGGLDLCVNNSWWIFTAGFINVFPFDDLYSTYNSEFANNQGTFDVPPCSPTSVPTSAPNDYMYNCMPLYDQLTNSLEFADCLSATGDPSPGQTNPTFANCLGGSVTGFCGSSTSCTAVSAGYQAENLFGEQVVTIPVFTQVIQYAYLSHISGVVNDVGKGLPNFYTWLDAHTNTPAGSGISPGNCPTAPPVIGPDCFRQAFSQDTFNLNPYTAATFWDFNIIGNIYDHLIHLNPLNNNQLYGYMTTGFPIVPKNMQLGYVPPAGTIVTFRFTLRNDISWHDGAPLTAFDVKYSYLTYKASGGPASVFLVPVIDVHVLSATVFDVNLNSFGPFTLNSIGSPPIIPGRHWSAGGLSAWDAAINTCKTSTTPDSCFSAADAGAFSPATGVTSPKFDPIKAGILIGSSAWECAAIPGLANPSGAAIGGGCSSTGLENPGVGGFYQLTRYGAGTTPGTGLPNSKYFRSGGTLALYIWTGNNGNPTHDFINTSEAVYCYKKPVGTLGCTQWQQGIGNPASPPGAVVGFLQVSAVASFNLVQWTGPFNWLPGVSYSCCSSTLTPPAGIAALPLTLYEGISSGNPGNPFVTGTAQVLQPAAVVGCTAAYPTGGYDC